MMRSPHAPAPLVALLLLLASAALYGQQRHDIMISPNDRGYRMKPEAMFQMADSNGTSVAVVWGTTEMAGGKLRSADYVQVRRNGAMLGPALRIGAADGVLGSHIRITPFKGDFLILYYDDARPDSLHGCWAQLLRLDPYRLEAPHRLQATLNDDGTDERRQVVVMGNGNGEHRIFWYDYGSQWTGNAGLYSCIVSADGVPDTTEISGSYWSKLFTYDAFPNLVLLWNPDGRSRMLHRESRAFDPRPMPSLNNPFHLGPDTSLVLLDGNTIRVYHSLFDTIPTLSRTLPLSIWGATPKQTLVSRDANGVILYLVIGAPSSQGEGIRPMYTVLRVRLSADLEPLSTEELFSDTLDVAGSEHDVVLDYTRSAGCNNRWRLGVVFGRSNGGPGHIMYVEADESGARSAPAGELPFCLNHPTIPAFRIPADSASIVGIHLGDSVFFSAPVARDVPRTHISPAVTATTSEIICSWREKDTTTSDVMARWVQGADTMIDRRVYTPPPIGTYETQPYLIPQPLVAFSETSSNIAIPLPGMVALEYNYNYTADVKGYYGTGRVRGSRFALASPSDTGWRNVMVLQTLNHWLSPPYNLAVLTGKVRGYDPGTRSILVGATTDESGYMYFSPDYPIGALFGNNVDDLSFWRILNPPSLTFRPQLLPMGHLRYLRIDNGRAILTDSNAPIDTFDIPTDGRIRSRLFKLLGPAFAMTSWSATDTLRFSIEIFDGAGNRLYAASVRRPATTNDYTLIQSPADSAIAILFGGENGLHATLLNGDLGIIAADTLLSQSTARVSAPNGAFRSDTLFMVWEDHRDALTRIYGSHARVRYTAIAGIDDARDDDRDDGISIYPNPTDGAITIDARFGDAGETTIEIITPLGLTVLSRTLPSGSDEGTIDIGGLPAGVYIARVRHGEDTRIGKVVKR
jgi:hypothetical protein